MNCREFLTRHSEYVDGVIEASAAGRMSAHAHSCGSCARYDRVVRRGGALVRELPGIQLSPDFEARLRHRLFHARDDMAQRRAGSTSIYVAAASLVLAICAAGLATFAFERTPVVDAQIVFAEAPRAYTPLETKGILAIAGAMPVASEEKARAHDLSPIESATLGHDAHLAYPLAWPVYSRGDAAAAFPKSGAELLVKPAEFRASSAVYTAGPILVRH